MTAVPAGQCEPPDSGSVADFYLATVDRTFATAYRVAGNSHTARDATHDAYVVMVDRWDDRRKRSLQDNQRYVIGIAVKKVVDWHRRHRRLVPIGDEDDRAVDDAGYAQVLDELTVFKAVRHLLEGQPMGRRAVGLLYFLEGFEYAEIAAILGIEVTTVRTQVHRLRERLKPLVSRIAELDESGDQP